MAITTIFDIRSLSKKLIAWRVIFRAMREALPNKKISYLPMPLNAVLFSWIRRIKDDTEGFLIILSATRTDEHLAARG